MTTLRSLGFTSNETNSSLHAPDNLFFMFGMGLIALENEFAPLVPDYDNVGLVVAETPNGDRPNSINDLSSLWVLYIDTPDGTLENDLDHELTRIPLVDVGQTITLGRLGYTFPDDGHVKDAPSYLISVGNPDDPSTVALLLMGVAAYADDMIEHGINPLGVLAIIVPNDITVDEAEEVYVLANDADNLGSPFQVTAETPVLRIK